MKIDYFKDTEFWKGLTEYNDYLLNTNKDDDYNREHDIRLTQREVPSAKSFPHFDPKIIDDTRYNLVLNSSYYMMLFLINKLYNDKKILIEDVGGRDGRFFFYLSKFGFCNFSIIEDFKYPTQESLRKTMAGVPFDLNNFYTQPTVVSNATRFDKSHDIALRWVYSMELVMGYTHVLYDSQEFENRVSRWGFKPLCRDFNDLSIAFCIESKYNEFKKKLEKYKV